MRVHHQTHGYKRGHQLLSSSIALDQLDQDLIDKLSDAAGSPRPGEKYQEYLTIYPLPSGRFHVIATTWQDDSAPRAGAVWTQSLLVSRSEWMTDPPIRSLFAASKLKDSAEGKLEVPLLLEEWPVPHGSGLSSLTEALFLEETRPVAAFGFEDVETITGRLLSALWSSRRATLAVCTHALGPRSLKDREFDLVFAPPESQSRFSNPKVRQLRARSGDERARHEWTEQLTKLLFVQAQPDLASIDEVGALTDAERTDPSVLRVSMLWSDLRGKTLSNPVSLIGMMDILRSLKKDPWSIDGFDTLVVETVEYAKHANGHEAWEFLAIMLRKFGAAVPWHVLRAFLTKARELSANDPLSIVEAPSIEDIAESGTVLWPAIGDGIALSKTDQFLPIIRQLPPSVLSSLMRRSGRLCRRLLAASIQSQDKEFIKELRSLLARNPVIAERRGAIMAQAMHSDAIAPVLREVLGARPNRAKLISTARAVLSFVGKPRPALMDVLLKKATAIATRQDLRKAAVAAAAGEDSDYLLARLVDGSTEVLWLDEVLANQTTRKNRILRVVLDLRRTSEIAELTSVDDAKRALLAAIIEGLPDTFDQLRTFAGEAKLNAMTARSLVNIAKDQLTPKQVDELIVCLAPELLALDPLQNVELTKAVIAHLDAPEYLRLVTRPGLPSEIVANHLSLIARPQHLSIFATKVDLLTSLIIERSSVSLDAKLYESWASLLREARRVRPAALLACADAAFNFTMKRKREPAGAVVAATFPIIHARLANNANLDDIPFGLFAMIQHTVDVFFGEWDKAKSARHGIVDAFLNSDWEPAELMRAGIDAAIPHKIVGYLISKPGGRAYLKRIEASADSYDKTLKKNILFQVRQFDRK